MKAIESGTEVFSETASVGSEVKPFREMVNSSATVPLASSHGQIAERMIAVRIPIWSLSITDHTKPVTTCGKTQGIKITAFNKFLPTKSVMNKRDVIMPRMDIKKILLIVQIKLLNIDCHIVGFEKI